MNRRKWNEILGKHLEDFINRIQNETSDFMDLTNLSNADILTQQQKYLNELNQSASQYLNTDSGIDKMFDDLFSYLLYKASPLFPVTPRSELEDIIEVATNGYYAWNKSMCKTHELVDGLEELVVTNYLAESYPELGIVESKIFDDHRLELDEVLADIREMFLNTYISKLRTLVDLTLDRQFSEVLPLVYMALDKYDDSSGKSKAPFDMFDGITLNEITDYFVDKIAPYGINNSDTVNWINDKIMDNLYALYRHEISVAEEKYVNKKKNLNAVPRSP